MINLITRATVLGLSALLLAACADNGADSTNNLSGPSAIKAEDDIKAENAPWGDFYAYFTDDTHALKPVLVGVAKIKAGEQIHPPHRHADEEYLMVLEGRGTWSLNGVESPAKKGDILYARAWDYHGVKAADDSPLEFVVFKYSARDGDLPHNPAPDLAEEQK